MTTHIKSKWLATAFNEAQRKSVSGDLPGAIKIYQEICKKDKQNTAALGLLGTLHAQQGNIDVAIQYLERAAELDARDPKNHYNLGYAYQLSGKFVDAANCYERALRQMPALMEAKYHLATCRHATGQLEEADRLFAELVAVSPHAPQLLAAYAAVKSDRARHEEAAALAQKALARDPQCAGAYAVLGATAWNERKLDHAELQYESAVAINPALSVAHYGLSQIKEAKKRPIEAINSLKLALRYNPNFLDASLRLGHLLKNLGRLDEALKCYRHALGIDAKSRTALIGLASTLEYAGDWPAAEQAYLQARDLYGQDIHIVGGLAHIYERTGRIAEAKTLLTSLGGDIKDPFCLMTLASVMREEGAVAEAVALLENYLAGAGTANGQLSSVHFLLGQLHDQARNYTAAFEHFSKANALGETKQVIRYSKSHHSAYVDWCARLFSRENLHAAQRSQQTSGKPVFVLGMPRSGTSLVEQILASHPEIHGAGELPDIYDFANSTPVNFGNIRQQDFAAALSELPAGAIDAFASRYLAKLDRIAPDAKYVTDKYPGNFLYLGLIQLFFPGAHIIHCRRNPLDTCLSIFFNEFSLSQPYATSLDTLGHFYREYVRLMEHWKSALDLPILDVQYEELVADTAGVSRRMIGFLGLEWNDRCLEFHKTRRVVNTPSYHQVRQPIYTKSMERWRNYEPFIGALRAALGPELGGI